ncbi:hypothetical protein Vafri_11497 [Volvox africanus]|nr:hypothetical protein Vafri_11497 [Volvox africanus]
MGDINLSKVEVEDTTQGSATSTADMYVVTCTLVCDEEKLRGPMDRAHSGTHQDDQLPDVGQPETVEAVRSRECRTLREAGLGGSSADHRLRQPGPPPHPSAGWSTPCLPCTCPTPSP